MRIAQIDVFQIDLPYSGGIYRLSGGRTYTSFDSSIVRLTCDDGTVGWGESAPFGATYVAAHGRGVRAGIAEMAPSLLGRDPRQVDRVNDLMDSVLIGHHHAKSPIDVACWDVFGQSVGLPVCELLGGSTGRPMPMLSSIHSGDPEEMRARVADHRGRGYRAHSVKIGADEEEGGAALDAERIAACLSDRRAGEIFIVDANGGLTTEAALRLIRLLPPGLDFSFEAPCATWRETMSLRRRCPYPIVLDELAIDDADLAQAIRDDAADGFSIKVSKAGGLTRGRRHRDVARAAGLTATVQDTVGSQIAFAAVLHLAATFPPQLLRGAQNCSEMVTRRTAAFAPVVSAEGVLPPLVPGLGLEVDAQGLGDPVLSWS